MTIEYIYFIPCILLTLIMVLGGYQMNWELFIFFAVFYFIFRGFMSALAVGISNEIEYAKTEVLKAIEELENEA